CSASAAIWCASRRSGSRADSSRCWRRPSRIGWPPASSSRPSWCWPSACWPPRGRRCSTFPACSESCHEAPRVWNRPPAVHAGRADPATIEAPRVWNRPPAVHAGRADMTPRGEVVVAALARERGRVAGDLLSLTKPRVVLMVLVTTVVGYYVGLAGAPASARLAALLL